MATGLATRLGRWRALRTRAFNAAEDLPYRLDSNNLEVGKLRTARILLPSALLVTGTVPEAFLLDGNGFVLGSKF